MPTCGELVTQAYTDILDIGADAASSLDHRSRIMLHLRRAVSTMWTYRAWPWTFGSGDCSAAAGDSSMIVPADFGSFGPYTKLWRMESAGVPDPAHISYRQPLVVRNRLRAYADATATRPDVWTFLGQTKLDEPAAPTVTVVGTAGITPYTYKVVAFRSDGTHTATSPAGSTLLGNAVPSAIHFNRVSWTAVTGAATYDLYRFVGIVGVDPFRKILSGTTLLTFDDTVPNSGTEAVPPVTNDTFAKLIVFAPELSVDTDFQLVDYRMKEPVLVDEYIIDAADAVGGEGDALKLIPEQYHESVLLLGLRASLWEDEGDDRAEGAKLEFQMALRESWAEENQSLLGAELFPPGYYGSSSVED